MNKKLDLRVQRTYKYLTTALLSLMEEKNFKDITVQEICDKAMVRRATFYKHFGDKYELITFYIHQLLKEFQKTQNQVNEPKDSKEYFASMIYQTWQFIEENQQNLSKIIQQLDTSNQVLEILSNEIQTDILNHLKSKENTPLVNNPSLLASMITGALVFTIKQWLLEEINITKQEVLELCLHMMR